jgi:hypothetical protein
MAETNFTIPANAKLRGIIHWVLMFTEIQILVYEEAGIPDVGLLQITSLADIQKISVGIRAVPLDQEIEINSEFFLLLYACTIIMNKVLVSSNDELTAKVFLAMMNQSDSKLNKFEIFRDVSIKTNQYLIDQIESFSFAIAGFENVKKWVNDLDID